MDISDLGRRFVTGGERELEELVDLFGEKLLRYATAILCDYHRAEEVVQDVFISAYEKRTSFDGKNISAWLYKITYNKCINQLKKPSLIFFHKLPEKIANDVFDKDKETDFSSEVLEALQKLKPDERALIYARIIERHSFAEISERTSKSVVNLRKQYERAKNKMAKLLDEKYDRKGISHEFI